MKIFYHLDNDGKCAAFWVRHFLRPSTLNPKDGDDIFFVPMDYNRPFPIESIKPQEEVYIVDFSIMPEQMTRLLEITNNVVWIDHHKAAIERYKKYDRHIDGVRVDGVAGCMLTYCWFAHMKQPDGSVIPFDISMTEDAPMFTKLIADYDVWTFKYGDETRQFEIGLNVRNSDPEDITWDVLSNSTYLDRIKKEGIVAIEYRKEMMKKICAANGFETKLDGYKAYALNMPQVGSDDFIAPDIDQYDLLIGFSFNGENYKYSLRSTTIDCSEIAAKYGGGGHKGAAGFTCDRLIIAKKGNS